MNSHQNRIFVFSVLAILAFACQSAKTPPTTAPTYTKTNTVPPPTATIEPTLTPVAVKSLCVQVETVNQTQNESGNIEGMLRSVFGYKGMKIWGEVLCDAADATLSVEATFDVSSAEYKDADSGGYRTCYTGVSAVGEMIFDMKGTKPRTHTIDKTIAPPNTIINFCPTKDNANLADAWAGDILDGLFEIFGSEVLAHALFISYNYDKSLDSQQIQWTVLYSAGPKLQNLRSDALPSIPVILQYLNEYYGEIPESFNPTADWALKILQSASGQDFGHDLNAWNSWWQNRQGQ